MSTPEWESASKAAKRMIGFAIVAAEAKRTKADNGDAIPEEWGFPPAAGCYDDDCRTSVCQDVERCYPSEPPP